MKWNELLFGGVGSLVVAVFASVVAYYASKDADLQKTERLTYYVTNPAILGVAGQESAFASVRVSNEGGVAAKKVVFIADFKPAVVRDMSLESTTHPQEASRKTDDKPVVLTFETLLPGEQVTVNFLLSAPQRPVINLRSTTSLGTQVPAGGLMALRTPRFHDFLEYAVPVTGIILLVFALATLVVRKVNLVGSARNEIGFLLLHHGLVEEAHNVLSLAVSAGTDGVYALTNLALCKGLRGEMGVARAMNKAAMFWCHSRQSTGVTLFNQAILELLDGHKELALQTLEQAVSKSPRPVRSFCRESAHLAPVRDDPRFRKIIEMK